ncbi:MogA/MoaB family molybdenum cofactor biosynthesis protein [Auraticoccus monumenti]|uniref:Molybdenum cofactor synthesis domain-containing protein n=1 Tax=Auraticoccus monumenti TaxID=675864 RepID=A0A1G6YKH8_9ACTN|nr:MogA/MoaB family molybdenum cofactor biosynthesis protein [Auraticoccus monumenti]SDD90503.1 molybdenum cofactor synthesis domain-containing protein [Auraticoccus monumenti]
MTAPEHAPAPEGARAVAVTVSTRAAAGEYEDLTGPLIAGALREWGFHCPEPVVVPDGEDVGRVLTEQVAAGVDVVVTTGGTGLSPSDRTPEQTAPLLQRTLPLLAAEIARRGVQNGVPTAVLSRGLAGVAGRTLVVNLPGSRGAVRDGLAVLAPVLGHAVAQLRGGGDHR